MALNGTVPLCVGITSWRPRVGEIGKKLLEKKSLLITCVQQQEKDTRIRSDISRILEDSSENTNAYRYIYTYKKPPDLLFCEPDGMPQTAPLWVSYK